MSDILLRPIIAIQVAVHQLREREDGQTTTEYAILLGFLAIAIIIALFFLEACCAACSRARQAASRGLRTAEPTRNVDRTARESGPFAVRGRPLGRTGDAGADRLGGTHPSAGCRKARAHGT